MNETENKLLVHIVAVGGWVNARGVADFLWPDSAMHRKSSNQGNGATVGKAAWLCGGSYAGKLVKKGLLRRENKHGLWGFALTDKGHNLLNRE